MGRVVAGFVGGGLHYTLSSIFHFFACSTNVPLPEKTTQESNLAVLYLKVPRIAWESNTTRRSYSFSEDRTVVSVGRFLDRPAASLLVQEATTQKNSCSGIPEVVSKR